MLASRSSAVVSSMSIRAAKASFVGANTVRGVVGLDSACTRSAAWMAATSVDSWGWDCAVDTMLAWPARMVVVGWNGCNVGVVAGQAAERRDG